jgi:hypothetical protein
VEWDGSLLFGTEWSCDGMAVSFSMILLDDLEQGYARL